MLNNEKAIRFLRVFVPIFGIAVVIMGRATGYVFLGRVIVFLLIVLQYFIWRKGKQKQQKEDDSDM